MLIHSGAIIGGTSSWSVLVPFFLFCFFFSFPTPDGAAFPGPVVLRLDCVLLFIYLSSLFFLSSLPRLCSLDPPRFSPGAGAEDRGAGSLALPSTDVGLILTRV